jgi:hypothetical protein
VYDVLRRANRIIRKAKQCRKYAIKQYRLKRKLLLQQEAFTSSETEILQKQKKAEENTAKTKEGRKRNTAKTKEGRKRNTEKTKEGRRKYRKNKRRQKKKYSKNKRRQNTLNNTD